MPRIPEKKRFRRKILEDCLDGDNGKREGDINNDVHTLNLGHQ